MQRPSGQVVFTKSSLQPVQFFDASLVLVHATFATPDRTIFVILSEPIYEHPSLGSTMGISKKRNHRNCTNERNPNDVRVRSYFMGVNKLED